MIFEFPGRPVSLSSPLYINRPPIEEQACAEIHKPGCLLRILAPRKMGKSSLFNRIIAHATSQGYSTVVVDFQEADTALFADLNKLLRWFCANVCRQLKLTPMLDNYWDEDIGSKVSCKLYFEGYLLEATATPVVLVLNELNRIFKYPEIAQDFLPMLRTWHEAASQNETWEKLRLVVVHSTEIYVALKLNQSPFNVGLALKLPEFSLEQVQALALRYGLIWAEGEIGKQRLAPLVEMVGGHPYLVNMAFYHLLGSEITLEQLLLQDPQLMGIYATHLRSLLATLHQAPQLAVALKQVFSAKERVPLEPIVAHKLESMGLIRLQGNLAQPMCQLYRLFFSEYLNKVSEIETRLEKLEQENEKLQRLADLDELTQLGNRRYFNNYLQAKWQKLLGKNIFISLILCDVDYFKIFNDTHGHLVGDTCLQQIAKAMRECLQEEEDVVARYGGEEFAVILPQKDALSAVKIAEEIRASIKALAIPYGNHNISELQSSVITISLGVASVMPTTDNLPAMLVTAADEALYKSKKQGRDRVTLSNYSIPASLNGISNRW